ncbi:MAG: type II toxin-antitoxin system PemK/MazF family toxin [Cyanobacteria bacterium P01_F01_bin.4]
MTTNPEIPKRGKIWLVNFDPTLGSEIKKTRPAIVISSDAVGRLPVKLVAPVTDWKPYFAKNIWHVKLKPNSDNGLSKLSAVDTLQLRGVDLQRFMRRLGYLSDKKMALIAITIATVIEASV